MLEGDKPGSNETGQVGGIDLIDDCTPALPESVHSQLIALAEFLLPALALHSDAELCIRLVDIHEMSALHEQWMGEPGPTDVLSFPMDELRPAALDHEPEVGVLGDIVMCPEVVAAEFGSGESMIQQLELLVVHGMLHLIGHDHAEDQERHEMFDLQARLLDGWRGVAGSAPQAHGEARIGGN